MDKKKLINKAELYKEIKKLVSEGKTVSMTVKGYSMNPLLAHQRDEITLGPWKDSDIRRGTVALVIDDRGSILIHRIIERIGDTIILEGDGNINLQEKTTVNNIAGIMHGITRNGHKYSADNLLLKIYSWLWVTFRRFKRYPLGLWRKMNPQPPLHK